MTGANSFVIGSVLDDLLGLGNRALAVPEFASICRRKLLQFAEIP